MGDIYNSKLEEVELPENVKKALYAIDEFEGRKEHWVWVERVFVHEDICYITLYYNVNWQTPVSLLEYDVKKDTIRELLYVSNEQIVGLKIPE